MDRKTRGRQDDMGAQDRPDCSAPRLIDRLALGFVLVTLLGGAVLAGVGVTEAATPGQDNAAAACQLDRVSPQDVVNLRERVEGRLDELETLQRDSAATVDRSTIDRVSNRLRNGNLSYDRARYRRACGHYRIALDQSGAALERAYVNLAEVRLASVADYIAARRDAEYESMAVTNLSARQAALAAQTANVSSLPQARTMAAESAALQSDAEAQLPSTRTVQVANAITPFWESIPAALGLVLVIGGVGLFAGRQTVESAADDTETGDGETGDGETGDEEVRGSKRRMDGTPRQ